MFLEPINIFEFDLMNPQDVVIPITYMIADFRDLGARFGAYSKTITIPSTKRNDTFLGLLYDISSDGYFNINTARPAYVEIGSERLLEGTMELKKVNTIDGKNISYDVVLKGDNNNWFNILKEKKLRDLGFPSHDYTIDNITASWLTNANTSDYVYPLIDYGLFDSYTNANDVKVENIKPAVFVKKIIKRMFNEIGYKFTSEFFKAYPTRDMILPFTSDTLKISEEERLANIGIASRELYTEITGIGVQNLIYTNIISDKASNFDATPDEYICRYDGTYSVKGTIRVNTRNTTLAGHQYWIRIFAGTKKMEYRYYVPALQGYRKDTKEIIFPDVQLTKGDKIRIEFQKDNANLDVLLTNFTNLKPDGTLQTWWTTVNITPNEQIVSEGDKINLAKTLPDMDCITFLKGIMQACNLLVFTDNRTREVLLETWDTFFLTREEAEDWTDKLDRSQIQELTKIDEDVNRKLNFKYKEDSNDWFLDDYKTRIGSNLGCHVETLLNEYLDGEKDVADLPFAPTKMYNAFTDNIFMSVLRNKEKWNDYVKDPATTPLADVETFAFEPRLLIYGGLKDCVIDPNGDWQFEGTQETQYPYAFFYQNTSNYFDFSLMFNSDDKFISEKLGRGLIDRYYKSQIEQINNKRMLSVPFYLTDIDIMKLYSKDNEGFYGFRRPILVDGNYFIINKVEDYLCGQSGSTKVELLQM